MEPPVPITFEQIRERAYELWERNHRPEGLEIRFWLLAERELKAERDRKRSETVEGPAEDHAPEEKPAQTGPAQNTPVEKRARTAASR